MDTSGNNLSIKIKWLAYVFTTILLLSEKISLLKAFPLKVVVFPHPF